MCVEVGPPSKFGTPTFTAKTGWFRTGASARVNARIRVPFGTSRPRVERSDRTKRPWRAGLQAVDEEAGRQAGKGFVSLAATEAAPKTKGELFFVGLRRATSERTTRPTLAFINSRIPR